MTSAYRSWSGPARMLALAVDASVSAAQAGDADGFALALVELRRVDREQLGTLLGAVVADLLERTHPDGMDSDDAEQVLARVEASAAWCAQLDRNSLIRALTGALGVGDPDEERPVEQAPVLVNGLLLATELLTGRSPAPVLDAALGELMRAQTVELP